MPTVNETPPPAVQNDLSSLNTALDTSIPTKQDNNLLIATWNIRSFASLTGKWTATGNDTVC
ncbi:hypothetical protein SAMN02745866_01674 [Alteromonadaceae bacterium Bs31]|nr:hypothetical protein SAMN02745866_01674 [Alteromonadaceae bacterium Bs31]